MLDHKESEKRKAELRRLKAPVGLDLALAQEIADRLDKAGIYYQIFRRVKTTDSLLHKMSIKEYNDEKKIQDYIGLKFVFYFVDDMKIAQDIIQEIYGEGQWSITAESDDGFSATKRNGVFRIPEQYLTEQFCKALEACCIDTTFEVQLKTMLFQSWHETEHDFRYKNRELWYLLNTDRKLNRVLATLELCDDSVIGVFDKMVYRAYRKMKALQNGELEEDEELQYTPMYLERIAQMHFRVRMKMQFFEDERSILDSRPNAKRKQLSRRKEAEQIPGYDKLEDYFFEAYEKLAEDLSPKRLHTLAEQTADLFMSVPFLKVLVNYDRKKLIHRFLEYKNHIEVNIYNICAMICTDVDPEKTGVNGTILKLLKRYLRTRYRTYEYLPYIPVKRYRQYTTFQCHADVYSAKAKKTKTLYKKVFHLIITWLYGRLGKEENLQGDTLPDTILCLRELMEDSEKTTYTLPDELRITETEMFDFRVLYLESRKMCSVRITEPDNHYENTSPDGNRMNKADGRSFITDIGILMAGDHVELAVRITCREIRSNLHSATAFRPAFIKTIAANTADFVIAEHEYGKDLPWVVGDKRMMYSAEGLSEYHGKLPVVVLPAAAVCDPDFNGPALAEALVGYGHVFVDEDSTDPGIQIRIPGEDGEIRNISVYPDDIDGEKSYVYSWVKTRDIVKEQKPHLSFGDCLFYRELKTEYYRQKDGENTVKLKKQIENLEQEIRELKGGNG